MKVEVVRAWPGRCEQVQLELASGATIADALRAANIDQQHDLPAGIAAVAVFGVVGSLQTTLNDGDRVELLRPLLIDPKQARRRREKAAKALR